MKYALLVVASLAIAPTVWPEEASKKKDILVLHNDITRVNWADFLSKQDLVWNDLPSSWEGAALMGNGTMGCYIKKAAEPNAINIEICSNEVHDHRNGMPAGNQHLMVGYFTLEPVGTMTKATMRLDLYNAETRVRIDTEKGTIALNAMVHADKNAVILEAVTTGGENHFVYQWHARQGDSPRQIFAVEKKKKYKLTAGYVNNPEPVSGLAGDIKTCVQPLTNAQTCTAWKETRSDDTSVLYVNTAHTYPGEGAVALSRTAVEEAASIGLCTLRASHRGWWNSYYKNSFISIPDKKLENFYWVQLYKLASATRRGRSIVDCTGPWVVPTSWPNAWWNLNVELSYWPVYTSNHVDLGYALSDLIFNNVQALVDTVPVEYRDDSAALDGVTNFDLKGGLVLPPKDDKNGPQLGTLPFVCHNLWLQYRYSMDKELLPKLFPLLKRAINYYLHFLEKDSTGKLHLPPTFSPEYGTARDTNFDLSLLRWGCETLLKMDALLDAGDPLAPQWRNVLENLVDYPKDDHGFKIGSNQSYDLSHRHFSHLFMIYPLHELNVDLPENRQIAQQSLDYWQSKPEALAGYSFTGAACIAATLGNGNAALGYLDALLDKNGSSKVYITPNTLYNEWGNPVIETPLSAAQSVHEMLLQSWGDKIRIFPAVPDKWKDAAFAGLRAEGAFLVSAKREAGRTVLIKVYSEAGEPCVVKTDMENVTVVGAAKEKLINIGPNLYRIDLRKGEQILLTNGQDNRTQCVEAIPPKKSERNYFGGWLQKAPWSRQTVR